MAGHRPAIPSGTDPARDTRVKPGYDDKTGVQTDTHAENSHASKR
jgi:hypothetical protein